jgi:hypothetical protein
VRYPAQQSEQETVKDDGKKMVSILANADP